MSETMCVSVPVPEFATLSRPGLARAQAASSPALRTGSALLTATM
jgi:hypothetical protein